MRRPFRWWGKKRGQRRTGSKLLGSVGEALFFGLLFLLGVVSLAALITNQISQTAPEALGVGFGFWLMAIVLSSFVVLGGGGIIYTALRVGTSAERRSAIAHRAANIDLIHDARPLPKDFPALPSDADLTNSPGIELTYRLPLAHSPLWQLTAAAVFCLVCNGFVAVLLVYVINGSYFSNSLADWRIKFVVNPLLGLGAIGVAVWSIRHFLRQMLLHTGVGPTIVEISHHPLFPGQSYQLYFSQSGRLKMRKLEVFLVSEEEATYHQGTDIRTESCIVHEQLVFRREDFYIEPGVAFEYNCTFSVPDHAMHSLQSPHNRVLWKLIVKAEAESWPTLTRSFPVVVYPAPLLPQPVDAQVRREQVHV